MSRTSMTLPPTLDRKAAPPPPPPSLVHRNGSVNSTDDSDSVSGDSLEGRMELNVVLPDGKTVRTSVEKRIPMMDLLVQVTKANKINPAGHVIHVMTERGKDFLQYKPNTAIGSLNASTIYVVPKRAIIDPPAKKAPRTANQPFETTFRLQVNLPRQQLLVLRVSPQISLSQLHQLICSQKGLDPKRYELRHPTIDDPLDYSCTLSDYKITEINMIAVCAPAFSQSTSDIITLQREEEKKRKSFFGFMFKRSKSSLGDSSGDENSSRGVSPARSDNSDHRSLSSSPAQHNRLPVPKINKKRPAPPPPKQQNLKLAERPPPPPPLHPWRSSTAKEGSHSRHSSDSSGYHEPSNLSNSPETNEVDSSKKISQVSLSTVSSSSLNSTNGIKKRRAPPPPKHLASAESFQTTENSAPLVKPSEPELSEEKPTLTKPEVSQSQLVTAIQTSEEQSTETVDSLPTSSESPSERDSSGSSCAPNSPKFDKELSSPPESPTLKDQSQDDCFTSSSATNSEEMIESVPPETLTNSEVEVASDPKESYPSSPNDMNRCITLAEVHVNTICDNAETILCDLPPRTDFSPDDSTISSANSDSRTNTDSAVADLDIDTSSHSLQERDGSPFISESASEIQDDHEDIHHADLEECNLSPEIDLLIEDSIESDNAEVIKEDADSGKNANLDTEKNALTESTEKAVQTSPPPEEPADSKTTEEGNDSKELNNSLNGDHDVDIPPSPTSNTSITELTASFDEVIADVQRAMDEEEEEQHNFTEPNVSAKTSTLSLHDDDDDEYDRSNRFQSEMQGISINFQDETEGIESLVETPIEWVYEIPNSSVNDAVNNSVDNKPHPQQSPTEIKSSIRRPSIDDSAELIKQSYSENASKTNDFVPRISDIYKRPISFSISTYKSRIEEENGYENKLVKSESFKNPIETLKARERGGALRSSSFQEKAIKSQMSAKPSKTIMNYEEAQEKYGYSQFCQNVDNENMPNTSFSGYEGSLPPMKELASPSLGEFHEGKSSSMLNLAGRSGISLRRTQSDVQLTGSEELLKLKLTDNEHLRLQEEYLKLQKQLVQWQQQLLDNQTLLQKQRILPSANELQLLDHRLLNLPVSDVIKDENCQMHPSISQSSTANYNTNFQRDKTSQNHSHTLPKDAFPKEYSVPPPVPRRPQRPVSFSMGSWQQREPMDSSDSLNKCTINKINSSTELQPSNLSDKSVISVEEKQSERIEKSTKPTNSQETTRNVTENVKITTYPLKETDIFGNINNIRRVQIPKTIKKPDNEREAPKNIQSHEVANNYFDNNLNDKYPRSKPVITNTTYSENITMNHTAGAEPEEVSVPSVRARLSKFLELEQQFGKDDAFKYKPKIGKPEPPTARNAGTFKKPQSEYTEDAKRGKEPDYSLPVQNYQKNKTQNQELNYPKPENTKNQYVPKPILPKPFSSDMGSRASVTIGRYEESSYLDSRPKVEIQSGGETKFRRQRVAPSILREDEQPKSLPQYIHLPIENPNITDSQGNFKNGHLQENRLPIRESFQKTDTYKTSEAASNVKQSSNGAKSIVYFSDGPKSSGYTKSESISAVRKVAENSVLSQPNIPIGLMNKCEDELDFRTSSKPVTNRQNGKTHSSGGYTTVVKLISPAENSVSLSSAKVGALKSDANPPPPPPPVLPLVSAKPVAKSGRRIRQLEPIQDPRDVLLSAIRDFGGRDNLRKVPKGETGWKIRHGGLD